MQQQRSKTTNLQNWNAGRSFSFTGCFFNKEIQHLQLRKSQTNSFKNKYAALWKHSSRRAFVPLKARRLVIESEAGEVVPAPANITKIVIQKEVLMLQKAWCLETSATPRLLIDAQTHMHTHTQAQILTATEDVNSSLFKICTETDRTNNKSPQNMN